jgi:oligopeptide/dipeptide ABC transporter ATP-binding protein
VGESGSGKSTIGRCIVRLCDPTAGTVRFQDHDITQMSQRTLRPLRAGLQMVFQDPFDSMNPRMTIEQIIGEPLLLHGSASPAARAARVREVLALVMLEPEHLGRYPHELSGGQLQRAALARALVTSPEFVVLDEPTSSLDASLRAEIVELLLELQSRLGIACLFISHDLSTVRYLTRRVAIMYLGEIVELGPTTEVFTRPRHPYTRALLSAVLSLDPAAPRARYALRGEIPSPLRLPGGCFLADRCPEVQPECRTSRPALAVDAADPRRAVRCFLVNPSSREPAVADARSI